jgi:hypothetical protein
MGPMNGRCSRSASALCFRTARLWTSRKTTRSFTPCSTWTDRFQIPGAAHLYQGCKNCGSGGPGAHWRGIYDDKGRIMVAISYNSDVGDAWEWADDPYYPEKFSGLAIRVGVNYIVYAMTH